MEFHFQQPRHESWMRNFNAKNTDGILTLYSENATVVSEAGTFDGRSHRKEEFRHSTGRSRWWVGSELHLGQYLIVMERIGNNWKIVQHFSMNVRRATQ